jgi:iron complex transport system substrate-binding protein
MPTTSSFHRRHLLAGLGALGATAALAACGAKSTADPGVAASSAGAAFPVEVTHKYGTTTVPSAPQRVVSVGVTEQDPLLAFGVKPVGVTEWYGEQPYATWSWATDELGDHEPTVLSTADGFDLENIAALAPDLIIGTNAGMTEADFEKLSDLAPTIANAGTFDSDWFEPWDVQTMLIAEALGRKDAGTKLVETITQSYADVGAAHPEWKGKKAVFLQGGFYEGAALASPAGLGTKFLTDLGFVVPDEIKQFVKGEGAAQAYIPIERLDVLDTADVLVWATDDAASREKVTKNKVYQALQAVRTGRSLETGPELAGAIYSPRCSRCRTCWRPSHPCWRRPCRADGRLDDICRAVMTGSRDIIGG